MKILKIELQNINSLKSDTPVVIDFENEQFRDVGLFAITGSTGAGKTTILDAITIALYHSVPRFNSSKGTLLDVVSFGANEAFSRVTFENNAIIYEGFWSVRLANKSGVKLKNAIEEVSLKNLSENKILASQKRKYIEEVEKVTQLDYNQFLRSVLLAQGEFASFLTAKGPEKGRLLEQITGEQIYKKIGQGILDRKSKEESKLKEIESKVNAVDILSGEGKAELTEMDKGIDADILHIDKEIAANNLVIEWFLKFHGLNKQAISLEELSKNIDVKIENHKDEFQLLSLHEKAEPFREITQDLSRIENGIAEKNKELSVLEGVLSKLNPEIENFTSVLDKEVTALANAEEEFAVWLPKLEMVTGLDNQIKNELENKDKSVRDLNSVTELIDGLTKEKETLSKQFSVTTADIERGEVYIRENRFLEEVDVELSNWTTDLITLRGNRERIIEDARFIKDKDESIENASASLKEKTELLNTGNVELDKVEQELNIVSKELVVHNISELLNSKKDVTVKEANWKQFKNLSDQTITAKKEQIALLNDKTLFDDKLSSVLSELESLKKQYLIQEKLVSKANEVLNLEKKIFKYEEERFRLNDGEPCGLCGSLSHPFVEEVVVCSVSDAEVAFNKATEDLNVIVKSEKELGKIEVELTTKLTGISERLVSVLEVLKSYELATVELRIDCELSNASKIEIELNKLSEELLRLESKIIRATQFQVKYNEASIVITKQKESLTILKTTIAELNSGIVNAQTEQQERIKSREILFDLSIALENKLNAQFSKFNYKVPFNDLITSFIEELRMALVKYQKSQKSLAKIKADLVLVTTNLTNNENQKISHSKKHEEIKEVIKAFDIKSAELFKDREALLPNSTSVGAKRNTLSGVINQLKIKSEESKKQLEELSGVKLKNETLEMDSNKQKTILQNDFNAKELLFGTQIKESEFESRQSVENALLSNEDKRKYTELKEGLKEEQLKNETLRETNLKDIETLNKSKNVDLKEEESNLVSEQLKERKDSVLARKGEIKEAFRKDQEIRDRNQEVYKKIEAQESVCAVWRSLFKIIGNSKDAFNVYVQRLTLKHLLDLANVHLYKLNKRYSLRIEDGYKPKEELNFNLIDHYQTDQARLVDTSSGGEKFIISLALALGLSDLASKNVKIDSLFIDEGFGTLDGNTLETVISTLETLQSQGKMIGVISHVENLKERISTQIQITKKSSGVSVVSVV